MPRPEVQDLDKFPRLNIMDWPAAWAQVIGPKKEISSPFYGAMYKQNIFYGTRLMFDEFMPMRVAMTSSPCFKNFSMFSNLWDV